ncbi:MAG: SDR family NAD(P)-dependent oxidoreductase, partial [Tateyamaria sp.]
MRLHDKTIIVTGASSGIGEAAARLFAAEGANVILNARREDRLHALAGEIEAAGGTAHSVAGDIGDPTTAKALVNAATTRFGGLDGAFNNAGMVGDMGPVTEMEDATWNQVIQTN